MESNIVSQDDSAIVLIMGHQMTVSYTSPG